MTTLACILLACGIVWVDLKRRKDKALLISRISRLESDLGIAERKRDVDPVTQSEEQIISEAFNMEKEMSLILEQKKIYQKQISSDNADVFIKKSEGEKELINKTEDDYDPAF